MFYLILKFSFFHNISLRKMSQIKYFVRYVTILKSSVFEMIVCAHRYINSRRNYLGKSYIL